MEIKPHILNILKDVTLEKRREFKRILKKYSEVFAWKYGNMSGIDRDIIQQYIQTSFPLKKYKVQNKTKQIQLTPELKRIKNEIITLNEFYLEFN